jgi:cytochrome c553
MSHLRSAVLSSVLMLTVTSPFAQAGDVTAGRTVMEKCQACHGKDGLGGQPFIPNLAGQKEFYLFNSLLAYKVGDRKSQNMADAVKGLSDQDMVNVAAYYAAIKIAVEVPK